MLLFLYLITTFITIATVLNKTCSKTTHNSTKPITVPNQTDVPILHYVTPTLNTTIKDDPRHFIIPFTVADINHNILGTSLLEEYIQKIDIRDFNLFFIYSRLYPIQRLPIRFIPS